MAATEAHSATTLPAPELAPAPVTEPISAAAVNTDAALTPAVPTTTATLETNGTTQHDTDKQAIGSPEGWPALHSDHPLLDFHSRLANILKAADHTKIWGVTLNATASDFPTFLILQKFLRSVQGDLDAAAASLEATLKWRREFGLDQDAPVEDFGPDFEGLGYITHLRKEKVEVVTWNLYGAVKDLNATFGDLDRFMRWRVGLMERAMSHLHLAEARTPIPDFGKGEDPHRCTQVHVYTGVSFLRPPPAVKAATKKTIEVLSTHYPESMARKLFVAVPVLLSWMFAAVRVFISADTAKKFVVVSSETSTADELGGDKNDIPKVYGGSGAGLAELEQEAAKETAAVV